MRKPTITVSKKTLVELAGKAKYQHEVEKMRDLYLKVVREYGGQMSADHVLSEYNKRQTMDEKAVFIMFMIKGLNELPTELREIRDRMRSLVGRAN